MPDPRDLLPTPPWEGPPLPQAFFRAFSLTPDRIKLVQSINDMIRQRTSYGLRQETITKVPTYIILNWSNGSAEWWLQTNPLMRRGSAITLDANQILVQGAKKSDVNAILRWLEPLPLYRFSFEAKERGFFDPEGWLKALYEQWSSGESEEEERI